MEVHRFSSEEARRFGEQLGIDWSAVPWDVEQFRAGMDVELEHRLRDPATDVTDDDPLTTGKIALAHRGSVLSAARRRLNGPPAGCPRRRPPRTRQARRTGSLREPRSGRRASLSRARACSLYRHRAGT